MGDKLPEKYSYNDTPEHILVKIFLSIPWKVQLTFVNRKFNILYRKALLNNKNPPPFDEIDIDYHIKFISHQVAEHPQIKEEMMTFRFTIPELFMANSLESTKAFKNSVLIATNLNNKMIDPHWPKPRSLMINPEAREFIIELYNDRKACKSGCPGVKEWPQRGWNYYLGAVGRCPGAEFKTVGMRVVVDGNSVNINRIFFNERMFSPCRENFSFQKKK